MCVLLECFITSRFIPHKLQSFYEALNNSGVLKFLGWNVFYVFKRYIAGMYFKSWAVHVVKAMAFLQLLNNCCGINNAHTLCTYMCEYVRTYICMYVCMCKY